MEKEDSICVVLEQLCCVLAWCGFGVICSLLDDQLNQQKGEYRKRDQRCGWENQIYRMLHARPWAKDFPSLGRTLLLQPIFIWHRIAGGFGQALPVLAAWVTGLCSAQGFALRRQRRQLACHVLSLGSTVRKSILSGHPEERVSTSQKRRFILSETSEHRVPCLTGSPDINGTLTPSPVCELLIP